MERGIFKLFEKLFIKYINMIDIKDKKDCCGCGACYQACPKNCITMEADKEGFLYPKVQLDLCINCKICEKHVLFLI